MIFKCPDCHWEFDDTDCEELPQCDNIRENSICLECEANDNLLRDFRGRV